ncbi:MAG: HAD family phosphatase [Chloroflexota bacterium]|nr:MAG: HAD family phosphatase [Chloroflexota bacterium]
MEAVIFDVGGVLVRTFDRSSRLAWENRLGLDEWELEEIVFGGEMGTKAQLGEISDNALWRWVGRRLELNGSQLEDFRRDFWRGDVLDLDLVDYILGLRPRFQTAIISNATDALRARLTNEYPIADAFDLIVVSAEEHIMKPELEIYFRTLERLGRPADEAVFVDDSPTNVAAAREAGMKSVLFHPALDLKSELAQLGVSRW